MQVRLRYRRSSGEAGAEVRVWMENWAGDQFERLTPLEFEQFYQAVSVVNKHFTNAVLLDDIDEKRERSP